MFIDAVAKPKIVTSKIDRIMNCFLYIEFFGSHTTKVFSCNSNNHP